jgi:hypothetical protein
VTVKGRDVNTKALSAADARKLTDQIKSSVETLWDLITRAYTTRAWAALDYDSWDDYCAKEFSDARLRLPREERQEVVASMREIGMSTRAIAAATGESRETIRREAAATDTNGSVVVGVNGKTYRPKPVARIADRSPKPPVTDLISRDQLAELNNSASSDEPPSPVNEPTSEPELPRSGPAPKSEVAQPDYRQQQREVVAAEYIAADPGVQRAVLAKEFTDAWTAASSVTRFKVAEIAAVLEVDEWDTLAIVFDRLADWWNDLRAERRPGLRIVGGKNV